MADRRGVAVTVNGEREWGTPMSDRVRVWTLVVILATWVVVVGFGVLGFYLGRGELPGAPVLGIPVAVLIALGRTARQAQNDEDDRADDRADDEAGGRGGR